MPRIEVEILEYVRDKSRNWEDLGMKAPKAKEVWTRYFIHTSDIEYVKPSKTKGMCFIKCNWMEESVEINQEYDNFTIKIHDAEELENKENTEEE